MVLVARGSYGLQREWMIACQQCEGAFFGVGKIRLLPRGKIMLNDEKRPAVTVVVPVYNVKQYLTECVESLARQSLSDIEVLLINDGSTDGSGDLAETLAAAHPHIRIFHKPNGGLSDARNYGIERATGEYIGFVDSDDWVDSEMFEKLYRRSQKTGADIVVCGGLKHFQTTGQSAPIKIRGNIGNFGLSVTQSPEILYASHSMACNKIFRRELFERHRFPVGQWFEDSAVVYNIMASAEKIECVPEQLYHYRFMRNGAITNSVSEDVLDIFKSCNSIISYYRDNGLLFGSVPAVLEKVIRNHLIARFNLILAGKDRALARRYINETFDFMDVTFPGWMSRYPLPEKDRYSWRARSRRSKKLALLRISTPNWLIKNAKRSLRLPRKIRSSVLQITNRSNASRQFRAKQRLLQEFGNSALDTIGKALSSQGVKYFADFGTLLGLVREGGFMTHDIDLDIGILADDATDYSAIRGALLESGCTLWREYAIQGRVVEESYYFPTGKGNIKFDINYYTSNQTHSWTFLFYRDPKQKYALRQRSVVKMTYSRISSVTTIVVGGRTIPVPKNAERLLLEKYGPSWRIPDTGWIYWQSPAAEPLPRREFYRQPHQQADIRPELLRELQDEQLAILDAIEDACRSHNLRYYLNEGTLLGAVRHQGYIPWDDDIDIAMPREDYDRLLDLPADALPSSIRLWSIKTDPRYHLPFAKAVSTLPSNFRNTAPQDISPQFAGPRIDIFPLDRVPFSGGPEQTASYKKIRRWRDYLLLKRGVPIKMTWKRRLQKLVAHGRSYNWLHQNIYKESTRHNRSLLSIYTANWASSYRPSKHTVPNEWYGKPQMMMYEGKMRPCPAKPSNILHQIYGEYMTPPPPDKRHNATHFMRHVGGAADNLFKQAAE